MPLELREQELEDILAAHPNDFFPDRHFHLIGRQTSFAGVGRFDLLFEDHARRKWLIELKAVPLKITDTDQVMRYLEELQIREPGAALVPCFVAPSVPPHVRTYLDGKGIDYREITLAEFRRVAAEHGVAVADGKTVQAEPPSDPIVTSTPEADWGRASRWDVERYERLFESLGFVAAETEHKLRHARLVPTLYFDRLRGRGFFTGYVREAEHFKPHLWEVIPAWDKKRSNPQYRLVVPVAGLEEDAFRDLLA